MIFLRLGWKQECVSFTRPEREVGCSLWMVCLRLTQCSGCAHGTGNDSERFPQRARARENFLEAHFFLSVLINGIPAQASLRPDRQKHHIPLLSSGRPVHAIHTHTQKRLPSSGFPLKIYHHQLGCKRSPQELIT